MKEKNKKEICCFCNKPIKSGDRFVLVGTYDKLDHERRLTVEEKIYHIQCWKKFFQSKIAEAMKNSMQSAAGMVNDMVQRMKDNGSGGIVAF